MKDRRPDLSRPDLSIGKALRILSSDALSREGLTDVPPTFGKFAIRRKLGFDGQATVLLAHDTQLVRDVVLKIYHDALDENQKTRIINEGRALAQINHRNVVKCYGVEEIDGVLILVLEYVEGGVLDDYLIEYRQSTTEATQLFRQLVAGIDAAHRNGVLHLDLKPSNVLVTSEGVLKLIDFGLVQAKVQETSTQTYSGTPAFMSPEVANGTPAANQTTDIFGLGAILYFILQGQAPFESDSNKDSRELARACEPKFIVAPKPNRSLTDICLRSMQKEQSNRYQKCPDLLEDIDAFLNKSARRKRWLVGTIASVLIAAIVSLPYILLGGESDEQRLSNLRNSETQVLELMSQGKWPAAAELQKTCSRAATHQSLRETFHQEHVERSGFLNSGLSQLDPQQQSDLRQSITEIHNLRLALNEKKWPEVETFLKDCIQANTVKRIRDAAGKDSPFAFLASQLIAKARLDLLDARIDVALPDSKELFSSGMRLESKFGMRSNAALQNKMDIARYYERIGLTNESVRTAGAVSRQTRSLPGYYGQVLHADSLLQQAMLTMSSRPSMASGFFESYIDFQESSQAEKDHLSKLCEFMLRYSARDIERSLELGEELLEVVPTTLAERKLRVLISSRLCVAAAEKARSYMGEQTEYENWKNKSQEYRQSVSSEQNSFANNLSIQIESLSLIARADIVLENYQEAIQLLDKAIVFANESLRQAEKIDRADTGRRICVRLLLEKLEVAQLKQDNALMAGVIEEVETVNQRIELDKWRNKNVKELERILEKLP